MSEVIEEKHIDFAGLSIGVFVAGFLSCFLIQKVSTSELSVNKITLSQTESALRSDLENIREKYSVDLKLVRKQDQLIMRIWDDQIFSINDWSISARGQKLIAEVSQILQRINGNTKFEISGHYDSIDPKIGGAKQVNKVAITTHRAAQVAGILAGNGLDMDRLYIKGYGDTKPIFKDRDQYGQYIAQAGELNRRLEIAVKQGRSL